MAGLTALPNDGLVEYLNSKMRDKFNRIALVGHKDYKNSILVDKLERSLGLKYNDFKPYVFDEFVADVTYFDENGVFTVIADLNNSEGSYDMHLYAVVLYSADESIATIARTPLIYLCDEIGGKFPIKIPIKGEEAEIVYRSTEYLTLPELEELHILPAWVGRLGIHKSILEKEIEDVKFKKNLAFHLESIVEQVNSNREEDRSIVEDSLLGVYKMLLSSKNSILDLELEKIN